MSVACEIKFDNNPSGVYFSGETLSGIAILSLDKVKTVRGLILKISGVAKCQWYDKKTFFNGLKRENSTIIYEGQEDYLNTTTYLIGSEIGSNIEIQPGIHTYNFSCPLPINLPTSFEGSMGSIRYNVTVLLDRPWKYDHMFKTDITILKELDLNKESPVLRIPTEMNLAKKFYCAFCNSRPLLIVAHIPKSGYIPGEIIEIQTDISNVSGLAVQAIKFDLKKIVSYHSMSPKFQIRKDEISIVEQKRPGVSNQGNAKFLESILIPQVMPTTMNLSKIIDIRYEVLITARIPGIHISPSISMPITIGTIPLNDSIDPKSPEITVGVNPGLNKLQRNYSTESAVASNANHLPPSYVEMYGEHNNDSQQSNLQQSDLQQSNLQQ